MIVGVDHINIRSSEYERAKDLFVKVLGLKEGPRPAIAKARGAWLYSGEQALVHLSATDEPTRPSKGSAIDHFALRIKDYDEAVRRLKSFGTEYRANELPDLGLRQLVVTVPGGATLELNWRDVAAPAPA